MRGGRGRGGGRGGGGGEEGGEEGRGRMPTSDSSLRYRRSAIETIRSEGAPALERMQSEMDNLYFDLTIMLRSVVWSCD